VRTPADERRQISTQLLRNLRASMEADLPPGSGSGGAGYWGSPLNSGRAEGGAAPPARGPPGEAGRIGGSQLSRNTRAAEFVEHSEDSTWGSPDSMGVASGGHSSGTGTGSSPWLHPGEGALETPGQLVSRAYGEERGSPALAPRSLLAATLDQVAGPGPHARRALAFGDDGGVAPAPALPPAADGAAAAAAGPSNTLPVAAGLTLPPAALQAPSAAELLAGSPVASPHFDQRNARDQLGPSSNTRRRSHTNIPNVPNVPGAPR
jgi:hypothetical protein